MEIGKRKSPNEDVQTCDPLYSIEIAEVAFRTNPGYGRAIIGPSKKFVYAKSSKFFNFNDAQEVFEFHESRIT